MRYALALFACALVGLLGAARPAHAQLRFEGTFASYGIACDCDPADYVFLTRRALAGRAHPSSSGRIVRTVEANRRIEGNDFDDALEVVRRAGVAVVLRAHTLRNAVDLGPVRLLSRAASLDRTTDLTLRERERIELLGGNGEGGEFLRVRGRVYFVEGAEEAALRRLTEPEIATYLHLVARPGKPAAWVEVRWWGPRANLLELANTHS